MKNLFFDLEFATTKFGISKICEFGYVVVNERFEVIKRSNFIIDPFIERSEWDYRVVKKILTRKISEYERALTFHNYYDDIVSLINEADNVFGHTISSDVKALNQDIERYGLNPINFEFYDVKEIYKEYSKINKTRSLSNIMLDLHIDGEENCHDAETDAYNTMLILKGMVEKLDVSINELLELVPNVKDRTDNFLIKSFEEIKKRRYEKFMLGLNSLDRSNDTKHGKNYKRFIQFLDNVRPRGKLGDVFEGKKVSISINYEEHHFRQMLNICQLIVNNGGTLILKGSLSDIFVKYDVILEDGKLRNDSKYNYVKEANDNGADIEIISFDEFLRRLNISEEELDEMPIPSFDYLLSGNAIT